MSLNERLYKNISAFGVLDYFIKNIWIQLDVYLKHFKSVMKLSDVAIFHMFYP